MLGLESLQSTADAIMNDISVSGSSAEQVDALMNAGTSMGGARPKAVVEHANNLWIAKFGRQDDRWNYTCVEHGMLNLACICGLTVAYSEVTKVAERDVLLVRRFDREWTDDGYRRHRMVSALTLMQLDDSMASRTEWSYLSLADEIRRHSEEPEVDLRELFARMCFNAAVSNTDDHPRNHAMLATDAGWRLSPAYDLTPTPMIASQHRDLAMTCGIEGRSANRSNLLSRHGRFYLSRDEATTILDSIEATVKEQWHPTMRRAGVSEADCVAISRAFLFEGFYT
jgi:serine/threonine-protein kinase HipA